MKETHKTILGGGGLLLGESLKKSRGGVDGIQIRLTPLTSTNNKKCRSTSLKREKEVTYQIDMRSLG